MLVSDVYYFVTLQIWIHITFHRKMFMFNRYFKGVLSSQTTAIIILFRRCEQSYRRHRKVTFYTAWQHASSPYLSHYERSAATSGDWYWNGLYHRQSIELAMDRSFKTLLCSDLWPYIDPATTRLAHQISSMNSCTYGMAMTEIYIFATACEPCHTTHCGAKRWQRLHPITDTATRVSESWLSSKSAGRSMRLWYRISLMINISNRL